MKLYLILSLLTGWLVTELKDFLTLGGVTNQLAFSLLKICFLMCIITLISSLLIFPDEMTDILRCFRQQLSTNIPLNQMLQDTEEMDKILTE